LKEPLQRGMPGHVLEKPGKKVRLDAISAEPPPGITEARARRRFAAMADEMLELQESLWGARLHSVLVVLQGRDAAGKDGAIKRVAGLLNPRGVAVTSFGVPTVEESQHDFLWRVHRHAPRLGEFAIFNRSHYEDVLVARVHKLAPKKSWKPRFGHIADFEQLLADHGTLVLKYFLHITRDEQEKRLLERESDAKAAWKISTQDWRERERWDDYTRAYEDAISKTAAAHAPWTIVPANAKWYRDLVIAESILAALEAHRAEWRERLREIAREARKQLAAYREG
jgi:PPK2 family polyphosphate:nucleotide phosphotransferase